MERERITELFSSFGAIDVRRMFGGAGIYADGLMFGLAHGGYLYLKADDLNRAAIERERQLPFSYDTKTGRQVLTSYWRRVGSMTTRTSSRAGPQRPARPPAVRKRKRRASAGG